MARQANRLTALKVKSLEKPGRYADGHNLWLQISENGGKSWVLRYMLDGKARHMGLGPPLRWRKLERKRLNNGSFF